MERVRYVIERQGQYLIFDAIEKDRWTHDLLEATKFYYKDTTLLREEEKYVEVSGGET